MTTEKVRGQRLFIDCFRSQKMGKVPWVAQMSAGFMKCHQESVQAAGEVCQHCNICVNYIFVLLFFLCVHSMRCSLTFQLWVKTSCVATQHLISAVCSCGEATAPPSYQNMPLQLDMAAIIKTHTFCVSS